MKEINIAEVTAIVSAKYNHHLSICTDNRVVSSPLAWDCGKEEFNEMKRRKY
jgi:hypothetical protein